MKLNKTIIYYKHYIIKPYILRNKYEVFYVDYYIYICLISKLNINYSLLIVLYSNIIDNEGRISYRKPVFEYMKGLMDYIL